MSQETSQQHNPPAVGISALLRFFRGCALDKTLRFSELVTEVLGQKLRVLTGCLNQEGGLLAANIPSGLDET